MDIPQFEETFSRIYKNFRLSGIPFGKSQKLGVKFFIPYFWLVLLGIEQLCFFVSKMSSKNFLELTGLAPCIGLTTLTVVKILCIALKRNKIYSLTTCLKELYQNQISDPKKRNLIAPEIMNLKYLMKNFFRLNIMLACIYTTLPIFLMLYAYCVKFEVNFFLPFPIIAPISTYSWLGWSIVYFHSCTSAFFCIIYATTVDALYYNLTCHICNNFTILSDELQQLKPIDADKLCNIIKKHQYILRLSNDLEDVFAVPNFFNVLVGSFEICAIGFSLIMTRDWTKIPGFIMFLLTQLIQIFLMSYFGENLIQESKKIGEAAYLCEWLKMDRKSKKMILLIMMRSNKPQMLTAYKFSSISYGSFMKIISTSWSYFTILRTVYNSPENGH